MNKRSKPDSALLNNYEWYLPNIPSGHKYPKNEESFYSIGGGEDEFFNAIGLDIFCFE